MTYPGIGVFPSGIVYPGDEVPGLESSGETFSNPCSGIFADPSWLQEMWIGLPGQMYRLPPPEKGYSGPFRRGETRHDLISGSVAITRRARTRRDWSLTFPNMSEDDSQLIRLLYMGAVGAGPFQFYDPATRNQLTTLTSLSGSVSALPPDWKARTGSLSAAGVLNTPVTGTGVVNWAGYGSGDVLDFNGISDDVSPLSAPIPWFQGRRMMFSCYVRSMGADVPLTGYLYDTNGNGINASKGSTAITAKTNWQRLVVSWDMTVGPGASYSYPYVIPRLIANAAAGSTVQVAAPQVEYVRDWATDPSLWAVGLGAAQVVLSDPLDGGNNYFWFRQYDLKLAEV